MGMAFVRTLASDPSSLCENMMSMLYVAGVRPTKRIRDSATESLTFKSYMWTCRDGQEFGVSKVLRALRPKQGPNGCPGFR